jgi:hypothetical protein
MAALQAPLIVGKCIWAVRREAGLIAHQVVLYLLVVASEMLFRLAGGSLQA